MKIRVDFVTNSSSSSYLITIQKLGTDEAILKELEKLTGFGPRGAKLILESFDNSTPDQLEESDLLEIEGRKTGPGFHSVSIRTQTDDYSDRCELLNIGTRLCDEVFEGYDLEKNAKTFKVAYKGERH
jgi:hypothetical protein